LISTSPLGIAGEGVVGDGRVETCPNEEFSTAGGGDSDRATGSFFKGIDAMDLSKLTDDEIELLERLLLKAAGEFVGDEITKVALQHARSMDEQGPRMDRGLRPDTLARHSGNAAPPGI
jgi:hypothetical protein